jgi:hypothetical protein
MLMAPSRVSFKSTTAPALVNPPLLRGAPSGDASRRGVRIALVLSAFPTTDAFV